MKHRKKLITLLCLSLANVGAMAADNFPSRSVSVVVPFPAGGGVDMLARALGNELSERWQQPVVVENRAGGSGVIAAQHIVNAKADGYTLLFTAEPILAINPLVFKELPYSVDDFAPISAVVSLPQVMFVHSNNENIQTLPELIQYAKKNPGKLTYASFGTASSPQLAMEQLKHKAGIDVLHVPYRGGAPAVIDLAAGTVDMTITGVQTARPAWESGKARMIAIAGDKRAPNFPDVPTFAEQGLSGIEATAYLGMVAPAKTPQAVIDKIYQDIKAIVDDKAFQEKYILPANQVPMASTPEEYAQIMENMRETLKPIVKSAGIVAE